MGYLPLLAVAAIAGATMAFQGTLNSNLGKAVGLGVATLIVHVVGALLSAAVLFIPGLNTHSLSSYKSAPWYAYSGGILSVLIIYSVAFSIPRLGVSNATTAIIVGQTLTALIIDCSGLFGLDILPFTWYRGVGLVLMAIGAKLMLMRAT